MDATSTWARLAGMFVRPRRTVAAIVRGDSRRFVSTLAALGGVVFALSLVSGAPAGGHSSVLLLAVFGGALGGVASVFLMGWLGSLTGRWYGGRTSAAQLRAALAWGGVPYVAILLVRVPAILLLACRAPVLDTVGLTHATGLLWWLFALDLAAFVLFVWSLVSTLLAISEVQAFSVAKAVGSQMLAGVVIAVPFFGALSSAAALVG